MSAMPFTIASGLVVRMASTMTYFMSLCASMSTSKQPPAWSDTMVTNLSYSACLSSGTRSRMRRFLVGGANVFDIAVISVGVAVAVMGGVGVGVAAMASCGSCRCRRYLHSNHSPHGGGGGV